MKNKGFTLIEIIGAIIIIGIIGILAVITFSGNMRGFRDDYYTDELRTLTESGKEFFNDNKKYRPSDILTSQIVPINTLVTQNYLDNDINDYLGNSCSNSSYVIIIKNGKDDYSYHACLMCPEDDFSNMDDKYCDEAWRTSTSIEYTIATPPELYVYLGTPKAELRDLLAIKASYVKKNSKGEIIGVVDGTGFDDTPTIYPENFDTIDTNTIGVYPINYEYQGRTTTGHVTVYKFEEPNFSIKKQETYATDLQGHTTTSLKELYISGTWTQKIFVTLSAGESTVEGMPNKVNRYQWNKDGVWQDICLGTSCTDKEITVEMNENIKFRSVSVDNKISDETKITNIKIDNTKPACTLSKSGPQKTSDWYTGNVTVTFNRKEDLVRTSTEAVSGIRTNNITISSGTFSHISNTQIVHNYDTKGVTYIGYVEDQARNFITCDINFRRDATNPTCSLKTTGARETSSNPWYNSANVVISFNSKADLDDKGTNTNSSGIKITRITGNGRENATSITDPSDTTGVTYTGYVEDYAGNSVTCTTWYKKDSTPPGCVSSGGTTTWLNHGTNIYGTCTDATSDCRAGYAMITKPYNNEINSSTESPGIIIDNAGNRTTCPGNQHVHIDLSKPKCTTSASTTAWTNQTVTITGTCTDTGGSGCAGNAVITRSDETGASGAVYSPGTVMDVAGNVSDACPNIRIYIDKTKPTCSTSANPSGWTNGTVTITGTCADKGGSGCTGNAVITKSDATGASGAVYSPGTVRDSAGNVSDACPNVRIYIDKTAPTCSVSSNPSGWTNGSVTISGVCSDTGGSGCKSNVSTSVNYETNGSSHTPGRVYDNAGNYVDCGTSKAYIDKTAPTCRTTTSSSGWTNQTVTITGNCSDTGGSGCKPNTTASFSDQQNSTQTPPNVADYAGNQGRCDSISVKIDKTKPQCGSRSYGSDSTNGVTVSVGCTDSGGSNCSSSSFGGTYRSSGSITIRDTAGNTNSCSYSVSSYQEYHTRTWNTCKTGSPNACVRTGLCDKSISFDGTSADCYAKHGTINQFARTCIVTYECCKETKNTCQGGWNSWSGYSRGTCSGSNTSTWQCGQRTMYHGG